jgi:ABC-type multidrug transport system fused ATPase/permease subunit
VEQRVDRGVLRRGLWILWLAIREEPRIFSAAAIGSAVYGVTTVGAAWVLGVVTDKVVLPAFRDGRVAAGALAVAAAAIIGVALLKAAGIVLRRLGAGIMQYRLQATLRRRVTRQYLRLPLAWHHAHPTGQLLSNANADVESTWYPIAPLPMAVGVLVMLFTAAVAMILTDVWLALVGFLVFPAIFALNLLYQRRLSPLATRAQQLRADVSGVAHESFDGALVVKALGREVAETGRFDEVSGSLAAANIAVGRVRGLFDPVLEALPNLGVLAVLVVGATRVDSGSLEPGQVIQTAYLFTLLAFPIRAIGWVLGELPRSVVGYERVAGVLDATGSLAYGRYDGEARVGGADVASGLEVRAVRYSYEDGLDVLHEVSFDVTPGRTVAVVGPTGSGKSTITTLLVRLVDPGTGEVLLDGVDARDYARGGIATSAAVVAQQAFLFDDTVRGNVTLGLDAPDEEVWAALRLAEAAGFVGQLPYGLDTRVGERGTTLSGGQRQRLALARALVRRPRLLVLDDATSSVDPLVEARILAGLRSSSATVVVVAYRKATIALADEVVYVEHGRVLDRGPHEVLLERSQAYRDLVTAYERDEADRAALVD